MSAAVPGDVARVITMDTHKVHVPTECLQVSSPADGGATGVTSSLNIHEFCLKV